MVSNQVRAHLFWGLCHSVVEFRWLLTQSLTWIVIALGLFAHFDDFRSLRWLVEFSEAHSGDKVFVALAPCRSPCRFFDFTLKNCNQLAIFLFVLSEVLASMWWFPTGENTSVLGTLWSSLIKDLQCWNFCEKVNFCEKSYLMRIGFEGYIWPPDPRIHAGSGLCWPAWGSGRVSV